MVRAGGVEKKQCAWRMIHRGASKQRGRRIRGGARTAGTQDEEREGRGKRRGSKKRGRGREGRRRTTGNYAAVKKGGMK